jgi:hypothetical protein
MLYRLTARSGLKFTLDIARRHRFNMAEQQATTASAPVELAKEIPSASDPVPNLDTVTHEGTETDPNETPAERRERLHKVPFGSRFLTEQDDVFSHNAWDHVVPPPEWEDDAKKTLDMQRQAQVSKEMKCKLRDCHLSSFRLTRIGAVRDI